MQVKESASVVERKNGNKFFKNAKVEGLSYVLRKGRLESATASYVRAEKLASNLEEYASASKNHGRAAWELYCLLKEKQEKQSVLTFYLREASAYFSVAYEKGSCKSSEWREDLLKSLTLCIEELDAICQGIVNVNEKCDLLFSFTEVVNVKTANVKLQVDIGTVIFHDAVKLLEDNDYRRALSRLKDCYLPIQKARRLNIVEYEGEVNVLENDVYFSTCSAESIQAREHGHQLLDIATANEESLNMIMVWETIDWYKRAAILARECDLEQEAIALSHLGYVYNKVLKRKYKSKEYYKKCFELAESMKPRTFFTQNWYSQCVSTLNAFQLEERLRDENEKQKERQKKLEALKEEMDDLKKNNTGKWEILIHVYNTYPPTKPNWKKPSDEEMAKWSSMEMKDLKKVLLKGIHDYHPDKVDIEKHGEKWKILCEEITKILTAHYEVTKEIS